MAGKFNLTELLNQRSKEKETEQEAGKQEEKMEIEYVDVYDLIPSKENFYHVDERLKKNIEIMGLLQPILVKRPVGGKYEVIAGHRRRLALIALVEEGKEKFRQVPCVFKQESAVDRLALIMANGFRDKTDWEKMIETVETERLVLELKKENQIKGNTREMLAEVTGVTEAQLGRYKSIYNNLIPELLEKLPFGVFATSSIDALIHGIESSLSPKGNQVTRMFGYHAIEQILRGYMKIRDCGRGVCMLLTEDFLVASCCAGIAFGNAGCAAVHALSYPLGAKYHVPHGEANYAVFDGVMKQYMAIRQDGEMDRLNRFMAGILGCGKEEVYRELRKLLDVILPRKPLREYGVTPEDLGEFTESVMTEQGRLMANNFTELSRDMVYDIYRKLY